MKHFFAVLFLLIVLCACTMGPKKDNSSFSVYTASVCDLHEVDDPADDKPAEIVMHCEASEEALDADHKDLNALFSQKSIKIRRIQINPGSKDPSDLPFLPDSAPIKRFSV